MICPNCKKPFYFIDKNDNQMSTCLKCKHTSAFVQPSYENYHDELYVKEEYSRNLKTDPQMKRILKKLDIGENDKIIDIGCGVGDYTTEIYKNFNKNVSGLDRSVTAAKEKNNAIDFIEYDCNNPLPFTDSSIDKIVSINLIEHLEDYTKFLKECHRALKKDGKIALTTANLGFILHDYFFDKTHLHEWTLQEFSRIISDHFNIEIIEKSSSMFKYYPVNFITTKFLKPDLLFIGTKK